MAIPRKEEQQRYASNRALYERRLPIQVIRNMPPRLGEGNPVPKLYGLRAQQSCQNIEIIQL